MRIPNHGAHRYEPHVYLECGRGSRRGVRPGLCPHGVRESQAHNQKHLACRAHVRGAVDRQLCHTSASLWHLSAREICNAISNPWKLRLRSRPNLGTMKGVRIGSTRKVVMKCSSVVSRREFITVAAAGFTLANSTHLFAGSHEEAAQKEAASSKTPAPVSPDQAWHDLLDGNARFVKGQPTGPRRSPEVSRSRRRPISRRHRRLRRFPRRP